MARKSLFIGYLRLEAIVETVDGDLTSKIPNVFA